ncbi:hypothetical protein GDO81_021009 [Engystomops pustulosus]|uniref:Uncharacterized protein n=1 Tax=Engystomops pustulosus TaxID=76066 RepID=A0AAV6Z046_ENGPU|nr:hypothetical protein GDO81_021009 [Engystomops pustulosus]
MVYRGLSSDDVVRTPFCFCKYKLYTEQLLKKSNTSLFFKETLLFFCFLNSLVKIHQLSEGSGYMLPIEVYGDGGQELLDRYRGRLCTLLHLIPVERDRSIYSLSHTSCYMLFHAAASMEREKNGANSTFCAQCMGNIIATSLQPPALKQLGNADRACEGENC